MKIEIIYCVSEIFFYKEILKLHKHLGLLIFTGICKAHCVTLNKELHT